MVVDYRKAALFSAYYIYRSNLSLFEENKLVESICDEFENSFPLMTSLADIKAYFIATRDSILELGIDFDFEFIKEKYLIICSNYKNEFSLSLQSLPEAYQEELSEFIPIYEDAYLALENADTLEELCDGFYDFIDLYLTSMLAFSKKVNIDRYENEYSEVYGYASEDQYEALEAAKDAYCQEMELLDIFYQIDDETTKHIAILYSILNEDQF